MYKVSFSTKKNEKSQKSLISIRAILPSGTFQASTGITVPTKDWNPKSQCLRKNSSLPDAQLLNDRLSELRVKLQNICIELQKAGKTVTPDSVKNVWLSKQPKVVPPTKTYTDLASFIAEVIKEKESLNFSTQSLGIYRSTLKHVKLFQAKMGKTPLPDIDEEWMLKFSQYVIRNSYRYSNSYINKLIATLKIFLRRANKKNIISNIGFVSERVPISKKTRDHIYLTMEEIAQLRSVPLEGRLDHTRNVFIVGCLTGLRYSDYSRLTEAHIQKIEHGGNSREAIVVLTQKTKQRVQIPLSQDLRELLAEIQKFKPISSQKFNDGLKEIAQKAGFQKEIIINRFRSGKHEAQVFKQWELFNSHLARRSFCTNAYKAGIPVPSIMLITGHTSVSSFMSYLKIGSEESVLLLAEHPFFKGGR